MCKFCHDIINGGKLKRHIIRKHRNNEEVSSILKKPLKEQDIIFSKLRTEGMFQFNTSNLHVLNDSGLMRKRTPAKSDELRLCSICNVFISNRTFYMHKRKCESKDIQTANIPIKKSSISSLMSHPDPDFVKDILNNFRDGEVGNFIRADSTLKMIGYKHFVSRKVEVSKMKEVKREIMMEMRELARLFFNF